MSLITRCPVCETMFKVVADQFKVAQGWVRCGYCGEVFDAALHLVPTEVAAQYLRSHQDVSASAAAASRPAEASPERAAAAAPPGESPLGEPPISSPPPQDAASPARLIAEQPISLAPDTALPGEAMAPERSDAASSSSPFDGLMASGGDGPADKPMLEPELSAAQDTHAQSASATQEMPAQDAPPVLPDMPVPDMPVPDMPVPDMPVPDMPVPDMSVPDMPVPDMPVPAIPAELTAVQDAAMPALPDLAPLQAELPPWPANPEQALSASTLLVQLSPEPAEPVAAAIPPAPPPSASALKPDDVAEAPLSKAEDAQAQPDLQAPPQAAEAPEVSFVREARRKAFWSSRLVRGLLALLVLVLLTTLLLQWVLQQKDNLAATHSRLVPFLQKLCVPLNCTVRPPRRIESVAIDNSSFSKTGPDLYRLNFVLKNTSAAVVETPSLEVTLIDVQEQVLVRRVLAPVEFGASAAGLAAHAELAGSVTLRVSGKAAPAPAPLPVTGYRLLAFYP